MAIALAALVLAGCGSGAASSAVRDQQLASQIANEDYARLTPAPPQPAGYLLPDNLTPAPNVPGNPNAGRTLFLQRGCGGCHAIRGLPGANGVAGPRLDNTVVRGTIAGEQIQATPDSLAHWIVDPSSLKPETTMPKSGVNAAEARDIAAFLYSLPQNP